MRCKFLIVCIFLLNGNLFGVLDYGQIDNPVQNLMGVYKRFSVVLMQYPHSNFEDMPNGSLIFSIWLRKKITEQNIITPINEDVSKLKTVVSGICPKEEFGDLDKGNLDFAKNRLDGIISHLDGVYAICIQIRIILSPRFFDIELQRGFWNLEMQKAYFVDQGSLILRCFENVVKLETLTVQKIDELLKFWSGRLKEIKQQKELEEKERQRIAQMQEEAEERRRKNEIKLRELQEIERKKQEEEEARKEQEQKEKEALQEMQQQQQELAKRKETQQQANEVQEQINKFEKIKLDLEQIIDNMKFNKRVAEMHKNQVIKDKPKKSARKATEDFAIEVEKLRQPLARNLNDATAPLFIQAFKIIEEALTWPWFKGAEKTEISNPLIIKEITGITNVKLSIFSASGKDEQGSPKPGAKYRLLNEENEKILSGEFEEILTKKAEHREPREPEKKEPTIVEEKEEDPQLKNLKDALLNLRNALTTLRENSLGLQNKLNSLRQRLESLQKS